MNNQRPYPQQMARPSNQAGPTIRAGLSVQELKAMTAMRVAQDSDSPNPGINPRDVANTGPYRNPASSYQTATPQQLQAAGIQPVVVNERPVLRQSKPVNPNSYGSYGTNGLYGEQQDVAGQNRAYSYDEFRSGPSSVQGVSTSSYAKASSTAGTAPALSAYHQQILPNRSGGPQINSVEDVKEMTRLRMLMAERDAFFESPANGNTGSGSGRSSHRSNVNNAVSNNNGHSGEFEPFEETPSGRYASRFHNGTGSAGPSVNNSTDSFDSYDYPAVVPQEARARGLQPSHSQGHSLYAPPSQQHSLYAGDSYGSAASSANSSTKLSQSSSLGGLGLGTRTTNSSFSAELSSPLGGPMASPSVGYGSSALRPNVGGPARPSPPSTQLGLGLAGSSALGLGQSSRRAPGAPLAPVDRYGYPVERGIERNLLLNAQLPSNHHHGLLNTSGGIDRVEHSLNAHNNSLYNGNPNNRGAFEDDLQRLFAHSDATASRLTSGLNSNGQGASGVSPTTHSARNNHLSLNQNNGYSASNNQNSFLFNDSGSTRGGDLSLNSLLGGSDLSPYTFGGPRAPLERDNLYDLLTADPITHSASHHSNGLLGTTLLPGLEGVNVSPQKVVLGPLSHHVSSPSTASSASLTAVPQSSQLESKLTPRTLAPLSTTTDASPSAGKDVDSKPMRKLSQVGKAATYNDAISTSNKDKNGMVILPDLSHNASPSKLLLEPLEAISLPPQRFQAFGDGNNHAQHNHDGRDTYHSPLGIASPDPRELRESDGSTASSSGSNSPVTTTLNPNNTNTNNNNKRFPMIKASTTSRLPDSQHPGTKSPKLMIANKYVNNGNNKNLTPSGEHTPPHTPLDRTASDSTSMNFLASEMAEMVLDTPYRLGSTGIPPHSRDNSSDLSRLLAAIHGTSNDAADNSLPSVTSNTSGKNFKRIPSISSFLGFE